MGGPSSEHEVSLDSGENIFKNLDFTKYQPIKIKITKDKKWYMDGKLTPLQDIFKSIDFAFLALHGEFGEDGTIQAILDYYKVPYNGSKVTSSALAMDKIKSQGLFQNAGLVTPKTLLINKNENFENHLSFFIEKVAKLPIVIKPCSRGSSVGVSKVSKSGEINTAIKKAFEFDDNILIEEFIDGREVTCGVVQIKEKLQPKTLNHCQVSSEYIALPPTEILPKNIYDFFDYEAKYKPGATDEITPAVITEEIVKEIQSIAIKTHTILGCKDYSRMDAIVKGGKIYVLEVNSLPGLTKNSLVPKELQVAGIKFRDFLDLIIEQNII